MVSCFIKKTKLKVFLSILLTGIFFANFNFIVRAEENMIPTYEVKFLLDSFQVLNSDKLLKKTYRDLFETGSDYEKIGVLFLETTERDFGNEGWINRIRVEEDASEFELTFKKRYEITDGDIDAALSMANQEGFDVTDTNYGAEVDWGYSKMTLSLSCEKNKSNKGYDNLELPKKGDAIDIIKDKMPGKEVDWLYDDWGTEKIEDTKKVGPVEYSKYKGKYSDYKVAIEIWPIENQLTEETTYITELSYKADTYDEAASIRYSLKEYLDNLGILLHEDSLKTQTIMDAYLGL